MSRKGRETFKENEEGMADKHFLARAMHHYPYYIVNEKSCVVDIDAQSYVDFEDALFYFSDQ